MSRNDIIKAIAEKSSYNLSQKCVGEILNIFFDEVTTAVSKGNDVQFVGFGTFTSVKRAARKMVSPATGKKISVPAKVTPKFRAGKAFKDKVAKTKKK